MYRHHFGLREKPFQIAPSPKFLFPSETHDESRARILYGIEDSRGFVVVYGRVGLGKTTVLLSVLEELDASTRFALIYQPVSSFHDLLRMTAHEFGLACENRDDVNLIWDLNEFFIQRLSEGEKCVLVVDEAQNLSFEILEKLRTLSNLQTENASLLQIVLVGQPELYEKLTDERLLQLRQRIGVWHEIEPLDREETVDYILHRLQRAGARRPKDIFAVKQCERVHALTGGVPRVINQVCDTAMMIAYGREDKRISSQDVEEAARELHLEIEERGVEPRPAAPRAARTPPRSRVWARISLAAVLVMAVLGTLWVLFGGDLRSALHRESVRTPSGVQEAQAAPKAPSSTGEGTVASEPGDVEGSQVEVRVPFPQPETQATTHKAAAERARHLRARLEDLRQLRAAGKPVYTVHLYSFRLPEHAQDFAREMMKRESWDQPLFMERSGKNPGWYQVFAGEFGRSSDARAWITKLKNHGDIGYAHLTRLSRDAKILAPASSERAVSLNGADG